MSAYLKEHELLDTPARKSRWKQEESDRLVTLVERYGPRWKSLAGEFPGRSAVCIRAHYLFCKGHQQTLTAEEKKRFQKEVSEMTPEVDWEALTKKIPKPLNILKRYYYNSYSIHTRHGRWTSDELDRLVGAVRRYGKDWAKVAGDMDGRTVEQCRSKWAYETNTREKGKFTTREDEEIVRYVDLYGPDAFAKIRQAMNSARTTAQLKNRYVHHLDPSLDKSPWREEEEAEFFRLYSETQDVEKVKRMMNSRRIEQEVVKREKAVIVILVRNNELNPMRRTLREFEDRFNRKFNYPYVFLNDEPFSDEFKQSISALTKAEIEFGLVPQEMWSVPGHVNETLMHHQLDDYASRNVMYGGSLSYRHMCRFNSGFFYRHPLLEKYDYYWRVEPGVHFYCDLDYDPFRYMKENGKEYGFTITLKEIPETIPTLWEHTLKFAHEKQLNTTLLRFFGSPEGGYNLCHYWSNFEIASLNLWRDSRYQDYFDYLDSTGNFFYERWGDAIVHSLAAGLYLNKTQVHFFEDIGYKHDNFAHCVNDGIFGKCMCPEDVGNFDEMFGSCLSDWKSFRTEGLQWDFRKNGDQIVEGRAIHNKKFASL
ncbi:hypothetical protein G6F42_008830 [Rhizopus arrhizus]|nr:hypothetical protein G6F42_008830 [Rhizopus arrhizus]